MFRTSSHGSEIHWMAHNSGSWLGSPELRICAVQILNGIIMKRCTREEGRAFRDGRGCGAGGRRSLLWLIANCGTLV
ncbi:hypothetical protein Hamer_G013067 [Homarus americanus]|uniref:Uncharacterized protein n=1 Tax=Homarus americanus TaxID=6706 RepID=A0A8J5JBZ9_HOMAM|nr:hypothetical protein Hamer_G028573 [Homarus americanus]KAG7167589.1 hypothetical protein Hamer_G013067 [Homarus americanus]